MVILLSFFTITTLSSVLIGDFAPQEEDLHVEKSLVPSKNLAAFLISLMFKIDFMCHALFSSKDSRAMRLIITYL